MFMLNKLFESESESESIVSCQFNDKTFSFLSIIKSIGLCSFVWCCNYKH